MKLDLGCGIQIKPGFVGVDKYLTADDIVLDREQVTGFSQVDLQAFPWPWADQSVEEVWCSHYIEHQPRELFVRFVDELWRVLEIGGIATIVHPNLKSVRAFQDPTHLDFIPAERWAYCVKQWRIENGLDRAPYPTCNFEIVEFGHYGVHPEFAARGEQAQAFAGAHYWDAVGDITVTLRKLE